MTTLTATPKVASTKKRKNYFRFLTDGRKAREIAEAVKRPQGDSVEKWTDKVAAIRSAPSLSTVTPETAPYFAPVLGVTIEALLNPPPRAAWKKPGTRRSPKRATPMSAPELKQFRGNALDAWMESRNLSALALANGVESDEDAALQLAQMIGDWRNGRSVIPADFAQKACAQFGGDASALIGQYTADEMADLDVPQLPSDADDAVDDAEPAAQPARRGRKKRVLDDTEVPRKKRKYTRRTPQETATPPAAAAAAALPSPAQQAAMMERGGTQVLVALNEKELRELLRRGAAPTVRMDGDTVVIQQEVRLTAVEFLRSTLPNK